MHSKLLYFVIKVGTIAINLFKIIVITLCVHVCMHEYTKIYVYIFHLYILLPWCLWQDLINFHFSSLTYHMWKIRDYILPYFKEVVKSK